MVLGIHPQLSSHSRFELQRRVRAGDNEAELLLKRHMLLRDIFSLQRVILAILLVVLSVIGVELFHWAVGFLISILIALEAGALARVRPRAPADAGRGEPARALPHYPAEWLAV